MPKYQKIKSFINQTKIYESINQINIKALIMDISLQNKKYTNNIDYNDRISIITKDVHL